VSLEILGSALTDGKVNGAAVFELIAKVEQQMKVRHSSQRGVGALVISKNFRSHLLASELAALDDGKDLQSG
jgi:hypothetical protein